MFPCADSTVLGTLLKIQGFEPHEVLGKTNPKVRVVTKS